MLVAAHTCPSVVVVARDRPCRHLHIPCLPSPALVRGRRHLHLSAGVIVTCTFREVAVTCTFRKLCVGHLHIPRSPSPVLVHTHRLCSSTLARHLRLSTLARHLRSSALAVTCARPRSPSPALVHTRRHLHTSALTVTCTVRARRHLHGPHSPSPALVRGRLRPHPSVLFVTCTPWFVLMPVGLSFGSVPHR